MRVAPVAYFVYPLLVPTLSGYLAASQHGYQDLQPSIDLNDAQSFLFEGTLDGQQWAHLAAAGTIWLVVPALVALGS